MPSSYRAANDVQQSAYFQGKGVTNQGKSQLNHYMPPRGIGGVPHSSAINPSYSNRTKVEQKNENEQGNSLDFIQNLIKRDVLSSPKPVSNHERAKQG